MAVILSFVLLGVCALWASCRNPTCNDGVVTTCGSTGYEGCQWKDQIPASCTPKSSSACLTQYPSSDTCVSGTGCQWNSQSACVRLTDYDCSATTADGTACANTNCQRFPYTCVPYDKCSIYGSEECKDMTFDEYCAFLETNLAGGSMTCATAFSACTPKEDGTGCIFDIAYCSTLATEDKCANEYCEWSGSECVSKTGYKADVDCHVVGSTCRSKSPLTAVCITDTSSPSGGCSAGSVGCTAESKSTCITPLCVNNTGENDCSESSKGVGCTWASAGTCEAKLGVSDCSSPTTSCEADKEALGCVSVSAADARCDVKDGLGCGTFTDKAGCETVGCKWAVSNSAFTVHAPLFLVVICVLAIL